MKESIQKMASEIASVLDGQLISVWLYGSVVLDDFHLGWSDIDLIAYFDGDLTDGQADRLVNLRQTLSALYPENPYYACFEGAIVPFSGDPNVSAGRGVYWGTAGQRLIDRYEPDPFALYALARFGQIVYGQGDRSLFSYPDRAKMAAAVRRHYETIRQYAVQTDGRLYSCGWLLDMARCMHTLRYGDVISKTSAGEWALAAHVFPESEALEKTLKIRRHPLELQADPAVRAWLRSLGPTVQRYADVLEKELAQYS